MKVEYLKKIADFELEHLKDVEKYHTKWQIREEEYSKKILTDVLEIDIIELEKLTNQLKKNKIDKKDKAMLWSLFIKNPERMGKEEMSENQDIKKAKEELEKIQADEREQELADLRMKHIRDTQAVEEYGYLKGIEKGQEEEKKQIILNMNKKHISLKDICDIVELSQEEVAKIIEENIKK